MYRGLEHRGPKLPASVDIDEKGIGLGGLSKSFGLPGLRIGWVASTDPILIKRLAELKDYTDAAERARNNKP